MEWKQPFNNGYWELIKSGETVATIVRGRVSLMCNITSTGKSKQFDDLIHRLALWRAKKWCEKESK